MNYHWILVYVVLISSLPVADVAINGDLDSAYLNEPGPNVDAEGSIDQIINQRMPPDKSTEERSGQSRANDTKETTKSSQNPPLAKSVQLTTDAPERSRSKGMINISDVYFVAIVAGCSAVGLIGLVLAVVCWFRLQRRVKAASDLDYPAYGVTGPAKERGSSGSGDRKLAQSAQMYHYQHQKQQMIAMEKANHEMKHDASEDDTDEENDEGDYTVYECPGLAPTGEMEVKNPLFAENNVIPASPTDSDNGRDKGP